MTPMMHAIENINIDAIKLLISIDYKDALDLKYQITVEKQCLIMQKTQEIII